MQRSQTQREDRPTALIIPLERADSQRMTVAMEPLFLDEPDDDDPQFTDAVPLPQDDFVLGDTTDTPICGTYVKPVVPWRFTMATPVAAPFDATVSLRARATVPPPIPQRARRGTPPPLPSVIVRPSLAEVDIESEHAETVPLPAKRPSPHPFLDLDLVETIPRPPKLVPVPLPEPPVRAPVLPDAPVRSSMLPLLLSALACGLVATVLVAFA